MKLNNILFYVFGQIYFTASGGFSERFLNLCKVKGVKIYVLRSEAGVLYARASLSSFRKIRGCASKSGMRIKITEKKGLPFVYARYAGRVGLFIGIAVSCFFVFFYTRSIWSIEVQGNVKIPDETIIQVLRQNGVYEGVLKGEIRKRSISFALYDEIPDIAWLNLRIDGSRFLVVIREVVPKLKQKDNSTYCNIVASTGGVIDKMQVDEGQALVKEGDGVHEGEMLVSGISTFEQAKKNAFSHSAAKIFAFTHRTNRIIIPKTYQKTVPTGRKTRRSVLQIFRLKIPLYLFSVFYKEREVTVIEKPLMLNHKKTPVVLYEYEFRELKTAAQKQDVNGAKTMVRAKKRAFEKSFPAGTRILKQRENIREEKSAFVFDYTYELYENIAKEAIFEIDEKNVNNNIENSE